MIQNKLVSIIVPVYNVEKYLRRCIDSLLNQTYKEIEIILIDDGSKDRSGAICDEYAEKDLRISCRHIVNKGVSNARNLGIDMANGEYITFVDSDDYIELDMIEKMMSVAENQDLVVCGLCQVELNGEKNYVYGTRKKYDYSQQDIIQGFFDVPVIKDFMYGPFNKLYVKSLLSDLRFRTDLRIGEDFLFVFEYITRCNTIRIYDCCMYNYEKRPNSAMTAAFSEKRLDYIKAVEVIEKICIKDYPCVRKKVLEWGYIHRINTCNQLDKNVQIKEQYIDNYNTMKNYLKEHKEIKKYMPLKVRCKYFAKEVLKR
ncbi:glycosyltransferase [[Ruminococcus] lactaris]|uniref:glycosyltransferase family 2 protein n=1 Tax=[Ruminococcus] lactaris TaxID=46228 RepID=UPI001D0371DF|nr:glycosyltransferase family 2 protein [[Ruminococcus] lactaris]MCB5813449.1 glycosyltransferase [[Ruminococcus] lactaris]MCB5820782.1 glycosyltransferase [[Ruminococcus] lactaris]MCB5834855.1 glycosyltransferase [[Ruminococcus] lactaris]MCB5849791.1 glycosyltransferase [[Ruminococcus] lactaris]